MSRGDGWWDNHRYQAADTGATVTHDWRQIPMTGFYAKPVLLTGLASRNGHDHAAVRIKNKTAVTFQVKLEEETSFDAETNHTAESVHWLGLLGSGPMTATPR